MAGSVDCAPRDAFVGLLPQEHERVPGETVGHYLARRTGAAEATASMEAAAAALGSGEPGVDDAYAVAFDRWMASGAADLDDRVAPVLADLGLDVGPEALMTSLSGGQAARVALAALLLSRFDVVLLDEPTNDLDLDGLARLETFVQGLRGGVVLVSHDREFLARCVTRIVELDLAQGQVTGLRRRLRRLPRGARHRPTARPGGLRAVRRDARRPGPAGPHPARVELPGRAQRDEEEPRQRQDPPQGGHRVLREAGPEGPPDGVEDRPPRRGRGAAQGVGPAVRHRRRAAVQRGGRHPQRGDPSGWATSSSDPSRCRSTQASGSASPVPTVPARPRCCGCSWATRPPTPAPRRWVPPSTSG